MSTLRHLALPLIGRLATIHLIWSSLLTKRWAVEVTELHQYFTNAGSPVRPKAVPVFKNRRKQCARGSLIASTVS
jgi:hypothetical protein